MSLIEQNFVKKVFLILGGVNDEVQKMIQKKCFFWVEIECPCSGYSPRRNARK